MVIRSLGLLALLAVAVGCSAQTAQPSPGTRAPEKSGPKGLVTVRVIVPVRSIKTGSTLRARVVIDNETGHVIQTTGCGSLFALEFTSRTYHPTVATPTCLQRLTIAEGRKSYPAGVPATYNQCGSDGPSAASPGCLPHNKMPPLPPGRYHLVFDEFRKLFAVPPAIAIDLIR